MNINGFTTNNHKRNFINGWDVPQDVLDNDFDWMTEEESHDGFIHAYGMWFHVSEFNRMNDDYWDAGRGITNFGAIAIKLIHEEMDQQYVIGWWDKP